jgi:hypothetical protein
MAAIGKEMASSGTIGVAANEQQDWWRQFHPQSSRLRRALPFNLRNRLVISTYE